uniref:Uncharacterized protein n=1 Tax=Polytomella parva TaxID=51329 RepID=A0A7S0UMS0_9CHLO|mmetsp:Transcript_15046/g.26662  ORF Transcript_15046/g.26662 Transcript_15046/m.26662 type:complete len:427 (+) Transcript_15046:149-1429(+)
MDQRQLYSLRQKLDALSFNDPLDPISAPLVSKLVEDLVDATESYRTLKLQCSQQEQEKQDFKHQMEAMRNECARLQTENSQLQVSLIKESEQAASVRKESYQAAKRLEDRVAELMYWREQALDRLRTADREVADLKRKLSESINTMDRLTKGIVDPVIGASRLTMPGPIQLATPLPKPQPPSLSQASFDILQAANLRIQSLQRQMADQTQESHILQQKIDTLQDQLSRRDTEILRLGARIGADSDLIELRSRMEAQESIIVGLNSTVDLLQQKLKDQIAELTGRRTNEQELRAALDAQSQSQAKLIKAQKEHLHMSRELTATKAELERFKGAIKVRQPLSGGIPPTQSTHISNASSGNNGNANNLNINANATAAATTNANPSATIRRPVSAGGSKASGSGSVPGSVSGSVSGSLGGSKAPVKKGKS